MTFLILSLHHSLAFSSEVNQIEEISNEDFYEISDVEFKNTRTGSITVFKTDTNKPKIIYQFGDASPNAKRAFKLIYDSPKSEISYK